MKKVGIDSLIGTIIEHKKYGPCEVLNITNPKEGKFVGRVVNTNEEKRFILSKQFFNNVDNYATINVQIKTPVKKDREYKKVDLTKYRNHPLVKAIDIKEAKIRKLLTKPEDKDEEEAETIS